MHKNLENKVAVVTGGSAGMGLVDMRHLQHLRNRHFRSPSSIHRIPSVMPLSESYTDVGKLLATIETHLVSFARNRERSADVAVPAAEDPLKEAL